MMTAAWDTQNEVLLVSGVKDHEGVLRIDLGTNLKGLVFVPSLYMEGIEGTRYPYVVGRYKEATGSASGTVATTHVEYSIPDKMYGRKVSLLILLVQKILSSTI